MSKPRVGVLVSGRGSNLQALIDAAADPAYPAELALVISNVPGVFALERAEKAGIPTRTIPHKNFLSREAFDQTLDAELRAVEVDIICLAGFMRLLSAPFSTAWHGRMLNVHPALLPSFKGLNTHQRAIDAGVKLHGCTVHLVTPDLDDGPIVAQAAVPVLADDTAETLAARVLVQEHRIYPLALKLLAEGRVRVDGNRAIIDGMGDAEAALVNPAG